jgi:hypothetical protein
MLGGYTAALDDHQVPDGGRGFNEALRAYLLFRFGWSTCAGWAHAIRDHLKRGEDELAKFFTVVGEFKDDLGSAPDDLRVVAARLDALTFGEDGIRRRRRAAVVKELRGKPSDTVGVVR